VRKNSVFAAIAVILSVTGCSSMQGVVRDKPTGSPISSATVTIGSASTTTDAMGVYHISSPDSGETMIINAPGYNIYTKTIDDEKILDIDLVPR
jgi:hypothetical protein